MGEEIIYTNKMVAEWMQRDKFRLTYVRERHRAPIRSCLVLIQTEFKSGYLVFRYTAELEEGAIAGGQVQRQTQVHQSGLGSERQKEQKLKLEGLGWDRQPPRCHFTTLSPMIKARAIHLGKSCICNALFHKARKCVMR